MSVSDGVFIVLAKIMQCSPWVFWIALNASLHLLWVGTLLVCQLYQVCVLKSIVNNKVRVLWLGYINYISLTTRCNYIFSHASAKAECNLSSLSGMFLCVDLDPSHTPTVNFISTGNFLILSPDLGSPTQINLEWYSFSNRSLEITLTYLFLILLNYLRPFETWRPPSLQPLSQSECIDNKNAATFWRRRALIQWECRIKITS